ncbi:SMODS-associated NUDIX domain-containing protein [Spirosoma pollinicola]|uniref:CD-NTase-associated protein 16 NUDIX domain-containing protein n=1 Tax=Spirosoma pollinicola TaxID=2057025 RepID=A0A2K8Z6B3_9BACT|nr:NUDIX hydrolase [Spirosoma pollinicola]AUD05411.1 hypothetical protein CWM47_28320 [Spirosoma pollinicola]RZK70737.1 MAG: hypothetical protein EOO85_20745 [Pedobacter sp.]
MKEIINVFVGVVLFVAGTWFLNNRPDIKDSVRDAGLGVLFAAGTSLLVLAWESKQYLRVLIQSYIKPTKAVRVSMAYLFRIEVDGQFLLVRNHKNPLRGYQPVGGVYKYLKRETASLFQELGIAVDIRPGIGVDDDSRNDLRCKINERRHLPAFLRWFDAKRDRETDPWREFYEELIVEGLLKQEDFPYIQYCHFKSDYEGIKSPDAFPIDEFLYADIIELKPENSKQIDELKRLFVQRSLNDIYTFATPEEIRSGSTSTGITILPHAKKILC